MRKFLPGLCLAVFVLTACGESEPSVDEQRIAACHEAVLGGLKAPATAEFAGDEELGEWQEGKSVEIKGSVDAQNGFGALIRNSFRCIVQKEDLSVTGLSIDR